MEVLLGITGNDFVLTASDAVSARSIVLMKTGEDKSRELNKNTLLLYSGESGDTGIYQASIVLIIGFAFDFKPSDVLIDCLRYGFNRLQLTLAFKEGLLIGFKRHD